MCINYMINRIKNKTGAFGAPVFYYLIGTRNKLQLKPIWNNRIFLDNHNTIFNGVKRVI